jgi:upstream activation factor subunit UAF30
VAKKNTNSKFMAPLQPSAALSEVIGKKSPLPRTEVVKLLWKYIKKHDLQDPNNKRNIIPDDKLAKVFGSKRAVSMFKMAGLIGKHLS